MREDGHVVLGGNGQVAGTVKEISRTSFLLEIRQAGPIHNFGGIRPLTVGKKTYGKFRQLPMVRPTRAQRKT